MVKNLENHLFQLFLLYRAKSNLLELYNHYIITLQCLTLHHMQIHIHLCSIFDRTQIFGSHNVKTKKQVLLHSRKKAYPRTKSNSKDYFLQEKITLEVFLLNQTHFMSRACFHQIIHRINSTYVFALGYLYSVDQIQPTSRH